MVRLLAVFGIVAGVQARAHLWRLNARQYGPLPFREEGVWKDAHSFPIGEILLQGKM